MKAWPVDFSGFTSSRQILDRIEALLPHVRLGHQDLCWAAWEIDQLQRLLWSLPPEPAASFPQEPSA